MSNSNNDAETIEKSETSDTENLKEETQTGTESDSVSGSMDGKEIRNQNRQMQGRKGTSRANLQDRNNRERQVQIGQKVQIQHRAQEIQV